MIWHKNQIPATPAEQARNDLIMGMHCACCALHGDFRERRLELHHIVRSHRLGEWYTLQLCVGHHRGLWSPTETLLPKYRAHVHGGRKAFRKAHGGYDDLQIWGRQQVVLGLDDSPPQSKIFKRVGKGTDVTTAVTEPVRWPDPSMSEAQRVKDRRKAAT